MTFNINLSQNLKLELQKRQLSQKDLVSQARVGKSTINGYIHGAIPKGLITLIRVSKYLGVSVDELLFGEKGASKERDSKFEERSENSCLSDKEYACFQ